MKPFENVTENGSEYAVKKGNILPDEAVNLRMVFF
jgi:hypothetical protein